MKKELDPLEEHPGKTFLFSYGSNNPRQAAERLEVSHEWLCEHTIACEAIDRVLTFSLYSTRWSGSVANLSEEKGKSCQGLAYLLPDDVLLRMDKYEGGYHKEKVRLLHEGKEFEGVAYVQSKEWEGDWHYPSRRYLEAIGKTLVHYFHCKKMLSNQKELKIKVTDSKTRAHKGEESLFVEELKDPTHQ